MSDEKPFHDLRKEIFNGPGEVVQEVLVGLATGAIQAAAKYGAEKVRTKIKDQRTPEPEDPK